MKILVSNDDGYFAPGLKILVDNLKKIAEVTVVAPDRNRSGSSSSLTLDKPLTVDRINDGTYAVDGTPTDSVHLALTGLLSFKPDMVISGINDGANLGDDTLYSGTVAAAIEGFTVGIPSIAVSMANYDPQNFQTAAEVILDLIKRLNKTKIEKTPLLNINVPDIPFNELQGSLITRLGKRQQADPVASALSPKGHKVYWVGAAGEAGDCGKGTDFFAVKENYVSITPIKIDLTNHQLINEMTEWIK